MQMIHNSMVDYKRTTAAEILKGHTASDDVVSSEVLRTVAVGLQTAKTPANNDAVGICRSGKGSGVQWWHVDSNGNELALEKSWFNAHKVFGNVKTVIVDGQEMVWVPAFYYKVANTPTGCDHPNCKTRWISSTQIDSSWRLHPAFMKNGVAIAGFYVGAYKATEDAGGTKMGSIGVEALMVSKTAAQFESLANARNGNGITGFKVWSFYELAAIQFLCHIEMKGADSQTLIAPGHVNGTACVPPNDPLEIAASYRGIYGLWGNAYQYVQGFQCDTETGYLKIWDRQGNQTYVTTTELYNGMADEASSGWINDFEESEDDPTNPTWSFKDRNNFSYEDVLVKFRELLETPYLKKIGQSAA